MSLKKCIFDNASERKLFGHLNSIWGDKFNIYPQLPFTKIFDIETLNIDQKDKDFLLKTNIDYTICDKKDRPLMCIEFDGLSRGYNRGGEYIQIVKDKLRKKKLELKLKIAIEHHFPFYIISYDERTYLSEEIHLTVIDGIIGQTIARQKLQDKINEYLELENAKDIIDFMSKYVSKYGYYEYIQDLVTAAEVDLELTWDPIAKKAAQIMSILSKRGIVTNISSEVLSKPELPEMKDIFDIEGLERRIKSWNDIEWHGCKVSCETPKGKVIEQAWVRNFEGLMASPLVIVENIAMLLAFYKASILNGIEI